MCNQVFMATVLTVLLAAGGTPGARAQQPMGLGQQQATPSGWTFNIAPYLWVANVSTDLSFNLPPELGGTVTASQSIGFGDLVSHLNFAAMGAADARYDRFSVLTDFIYMDLGGTAAHFRSVNFPNRPAIPIQAGTQSSQSLNLNNTIWTLAGGYTLAEGAWGNFDAIAGFRLFQVSARVNYSLG